MSEPTPTDTPPPGFWQRPAIRGLVNGVVFAVILTVIRVLGLFQPAMPLSEDVVAGNILGGFVFGFAVYILELWRRQRRTKAADVARETVERRLKERDSEGGEDAR